VAYQKSVDDFNLQASVFGRESSAHFMPDRTGDLFFDGVASDVKRTLYSGGFQADASYALNDQHTLRGGVLAMDEAVSAHSTTTVFPVDDIGNPTGAPFPITDRNVLHGIFAGVYLQDEWKILPQLTINYGARFDEFYSSFDKENQPSPRVNLIYTPTDTTTLHAGYARYFTPPPVENVPGGTVAQFDGTSNSTGNDEDRAVKAERANYFDAGATQKIGKHLQMGVDGYYKKAHNQLDDGLFGQSLILSAFNYSEGRIYGVEFPISYNLGGFDAYANLSYSVAKGKNWSSAQFLFGPGGSGTDLSYVHHHWIYLDHDQTVSGSFGASYTWKHSWGGTRCYVDALYGSGLRTDAPNASGQNVPNGGTVPAYYSVNLGAEESFKLSEKRMLKARLDVVNLTDNSYELRDGAGVGVNAASFGERLGFFGSLTYVF
jgi:outer membrane receptor protein involved in Fe transport